MNQWMQGSKKVGHENGELDQRVPLLEMGFEGAERMPVRHKTAPQLNEGRRGEQ